MMRRWRRIHRSHYSSSSILPLLSLKLMNMGVVMFILLLVFSFLFLPIVFLLYSRQLPHPDRVVRREGFSTVVLDRNGKPLYDIYQNENRIPVGKDDIPVFLKQAITAIEDKDFYNHEGFDPKGIIRAVFKILTFQGVQGGSTLTQQLVKNVLLTGERTLPRKIKEFILAIQIEQKYSKDEILQMYLNESPFGGTMWGIEAAAQGYFGKSTKDLLLLEAVILAGLPQRPSYYSPFGENNTAYIVRSEEVLRRMQEDGYITQVEEHELKSQLPQVKFEGSSGRFRAPHFVLFVKKLLIEKFGEKLVESGGLRVTTTVDVDLQTAAQDIVSEELDKLKSLNVGNGASVVLNPKNGEILAYVGSRDFFAEEEKEGQFDIVTLAKRQPGSALKPITYAVAFSKGYTPASLIMDVETHFPKGQDGKDYVPKNYDGKFRGPVQLRFALGNSLNIPAVKLTALVGVMDILKTAFDMGISTLEPTVENANRLGLSITLGGGEVTLLDITSAFGTFATGGVREEPVAILKVVNKENETIFEQKQAAGRQVLSPDVSFLISHILSDNNARKEIFGPNSHLVVPGHTVAVKTGTTDDRKDNWAIGYTPSIVAGVWVGNNDGTPMSQKLASGVTGAAPIWNRIMKEALHDTGEEEFEKPDSVTALEIDAFGGGLPKDGKPKRSEYFITHTEPTGISSLYKSLKLSKNDHEKLANAAEIALGHYEEKEFIVFAEEDPLSDDGKNRWQEGIDAWLGSQTDSLYKAPKETSHTSEDTVVVQIKKPGDKETLSSQDITIEAVGKSVKPVTKMELYINDTLKSSVSKNEMTETLHLDPGIYTLKVKASTGEKEGDSTILFGVMTAVVSPTQSPTPSP